MMAGAYTLAKNGHVRGDVLYGFFPPRLQAGLDLTLYLLFFIPGVVAFLWAGYYYAGESWAIREGSNITADGPPYYPFKTVIPIAGAFLLVQGIVEIIRCVICLKQGDWPSRVDGRRGSRRRQAEGRWCTSRTRTSPSSIEFVVAQRGSAQMRKEVWFGLSIMALVVTMVFVLMPAPSQMTNGHLGLLMLALIVVGIMLGFPTAFTLMGMGVFFGWLAYHSADPATANRQILDLMVQRAYSVMSNDVLIAIPLFVFMGYLVERAALIDRLFKSLHLATARVPGALAVATHRHLRHLRHRHRHRRRGRDADGAARVSGDAESRIQHQGRRRRDHRGRLPRHPDPAFGAADRLRRRCGRVRGAALRRRVRPRHHARRAVHRLRHRAREAAAGPDAAAARERARGCAAFVCREACAAGRQRAGRAVARGDRRRERRCGEGNGVRAVADHADSGALRRRHAGRDVAIRDRAGRHRRYRGPRSRPAPRTPTVGRGTSDAQTPVPTGCRRPCRSRRRKPTPSPRRLPRHPRSRARSHRRPPQRRSRAKAAAAEKAPAARTSDRSGFPTPTWFWIVVAIGVALLVVLYWYLELGAARSVQDAAGLVLPARHPDPDGPGLDRLRSRDADGSRGGGRARRGHSRRGLPLHRALARGAAARRTSPAPPSGPRSRSWAASSRTRRS